MAAREVSDLMMFPYDYRQDSTGGRYLKFIHRGFPGGCDTYRFIYESYLPAITPDDLPYNQEFRAATGAPGIRIESAILYGE
jgi:hypothetical protein